MRIIGYRFLALIIDSMSVVRYRNLIAIKEPLRTKYETQTNKYTFFPQVWSLVHILPMLGLNTFRRYYITKGMLLCFVISQYDQDLISIYLLHS